MDNSSIPERTTELLAEGWSLTVSRFTPYQKTEIVYYVELFTWGMAKNGSRRARKSFIGSDPEFGIAVQKATDHACVWLSARP